MLHPHKLLWHCGHCDTWHHLCPKLHQPTRRYSCACGISCLCSLFRSGEEIPVRPGSQCVHLLCDRSRFYHPNPLSLLLAENSIISHLAVAPPQWLSSQRHFIHLLV